MNKKEQKKICIILKKRQRQRMYGTEQRGNTTSIDRRDPFKYSHHAENGNEIFIFS